MLEWSRWAHSWQKLADDGAIVDPLFVIPLPVQDLVSAARTDNAVARALIAKRNPVIEDAIEQGRAEGQATGRSEALQGARSHLLQVILATLEERGIAVSEAQQEALQAIEDMGVLSRILVRTATCENASTLLQG